MKRVIKQIYKECGNCGKLKDCRTLNIRYQDFKQTYRTSQWNPNRKAFWVYHTQNYLLCKTCQRIFIKTLTNLK